MATPAEHLRPGEWTSLEPYAQLVRSLLPRASSIAVFDSNANPRWSNDSATWPEFVQAVEQDRVLLVEAAPHPVVVLDGELDRLDPLEVGLIERRPDTRH